METRGRTQDKNGHGSRDGNESNSGDGNGDEDGNGDGNEGGIGAGGGETKERKKLHKNCRRDRHFHSARVIISADKRWHLRAPDSSVYKARCLYTHIAPRG